MFNKGDSNKVSSKKVRYDKRRNQKASNVGNKNRKTETISNQRTPQAVSYTHLDVYKRQSLYFQNILLA